MYVFYTQLLQLVNAQHTTKTEDGQVCQRTNQPKNKTWNQESLVCMLTKWQFCPDKILKEAFSLLVIYYWIFQTPVNVILVNYLFPLHVQDGGS